MVTAAHHDGCRAIAKDNREEGDTAAEEEPKRGGRVGAWRSAAARANQQQKIVGLMESMASAAAAGVGRLERAEPSSVSRELRSMEGLRLRSLSSNLDDTSYIFPRVN